MGQPHPTWREVYTDRLSSPHGRGRRVKLLAAELQATLDLLVDEVPRRRWGRGLAYFIETVPPDGGPGVGNVARDVINMLLPGKYGLRTNADKISPEVVAQVCSLEETCRQILQDGPVRAFGIGVVEGGKSPQSDDVKSFWKVVRAAENDDGAEVTVGPILHLAGRFLAPPEPYRLGPVRLQIDQRTAIMTVGAPPDLAGESLRSFLMEVLVDAVARTQTAVSRKKLPWSLDANRNLVERVRADLRDADLG